MFINYRHDDTDAAALLLWDRLAQRYGDANVFLDVKSLEAGTRWLEEIKSQGSRGAAVLALIGRDWLEELKKRQRLQASDPEDYVVLELELALGRWPGTVIPIVIGGASMPEAVSLPRPIRGLAAIQGVELRHASFDQDLAGLMAKLDAIESGIADPPAVSVAEAPAGPDGNAAGAPTPPSAAPPTPPPAALPTPPPAAPATVPQTAPPAVAAAVAAVVTSEPVLPGPDAAHYETVLECMVEEGTVVPVLGSRVRGSLPDAEQLAAHLASKFNLSESHDLAEVAQHVLVAKGPSSLFREMKQVLRGQAEPTKVHDFLARFPERLDELGLPARNQMIVTTNYDDALERAFETAGTPYDLAVFIASGEEKGRFVHVPWKGEPQLIAEASKYREFPIDGNDELERSVIVKIQGAVDGREGVLHWDRSYVLTEDQYIDYMVTDQIGSVVPLQILNKLTSSHCLFLGYAMRDWSLRVFLKRIWQGHPLEDKSWAIERAPDGLEKDFWSSLHVELLACPLDDYVDQLNARMTALHPTGT